ncbi:MAG: twin-arginine translocase subunit TatC [Parvibaculales bacterium]
MKKQEEASAPLLEHFQELRQRLLACLIAIIIFFAVTIFFAEDIFMLLVLPYKSFFINFNHQPEFIFTAPPELFFTYVKLALFASIFLSSPFILWQIYRLVAPGLYKQERHVFIPYLIAGPVLFTLGGVTVLFGVLPLALQFFINMQPGAEALASITMLPKVSEYLSFVMVLMLAFGICFQLPIILTLMAHAGLVSSAGLKEKRRYAIIIIFLIAAFLTPPDIISQLGLSIPTLLLYELSILAVKLVEKKEGKK